MVGCRSEQTAQLKLWGPPNGVAECWTSAGRACDSWQRRYAHKFAAPECPNLLKLRAAIEQNLNPICFYVKNDYAMGHHVYDQHFYVRHHTNSTKPQH